MGDRFDQLGFGGAVVLGEVEVEAQLVGVAERCERGDSDQAAFLAGQAGAFPHLAEQDVVGETDESWCEVAEHALGAGRLSLLGVGHGCSLSMGTIRSVAAVAFGVTIPSTKLDRPYLALYPGSTISESASGAGSNATSPSTAPRRTSPRPVA